ncbi:Denitrification regulatory protein NirQ [Geodia barretti]|uniref:Denitrification regulatory protein NirQ n=2 Tax=Geodia barretti TaxID=519541 RepID=A0AA35SNC8_GEOBA|nr:Denitrification regulatory protein NirQ [Geodia barretti]
MSVPYYRPIQREVEVFEHAYRNQLALMIKGPTGCGKTRFVEAMAAKAERPLVTVACHDDTTATDLLGRHLVEGGDTVWQDGPLTRAIRQGAILYLDEIVEAREDVVVVLHSLADHRRQIYLDRLNETLTAPAEFMLVISFNPGYQRGFKELKPSTRQRFVGLSFQYPEPAVEAEIVAQESGIDLAMAKRLVAFAGKVRNLQEFGLSATASTRLLAHAGRLMHTGMPPRTACHVGVIEPLTDDDDIRSALQDTANLIL